MIAGGEGWEGNVREDRLRMRAREGHGQLLGRLPRRSAADRGFYSVANVAWADAAAAELVSIPQRGGHKTPARAAFEKSRHFKRAQKFRAGIEGRISVLGRGRGMKRCLLRGRAGFEVLVGAAVLVGDEGRVIRRPDGPVPSGWTTSARFDSRRPHERRRRNSRSRRRYRRLWSL